MYDEETEKEEVLLGSEFKEKDNKKDNFRAFFKKYPSQSSSQIPI